MLLLAFFAGTLTSAQAQRPSVKLRNLEASPGDGYTIRTDANGKAFWIMNVAGDINVVLTPIAYIPTASGNVLNTNNVVTDPNSDIWIIDSAGDAVKIGNTSSFSGSWNDLTNIPAGFADKTYNANDPDADPLNEIQNSSGVALSSQLVISGNIVNDVQSALQAIVNAGVGTGSGFSGDWSDLTNVPAGFADNTDNIGSLDSTRLLQDSILVYYLDGVESSRDTIKGVGGGAGGSTTWASITGKPAGFADDVDDVDDADANATIEIQTLSFVTDQLSLSN